MNEEKEFRIIKTFKFNNNIYYYLNSCDGDTFFLKDVNGSYDYLEWDEYIKVNSIFDKKRDRDKLFSSDSKDKVYSVTLENTNTKRKKRVRTAKYVWYRNILLPVALLVLSASLVKPTLDLNSYLFDHSLNETSINKYGVSSSYNLNYVNDDIDVMMYFVDGVDTTKFPSFSKFLNEENFYSSYSIIDKDTFCNQNNITQPSYDELRNVVNNRDDIEDYDKKLFIEFIDIIEEKYPSMDLRLLLYNLKNVSIEYSGWHYFAVNVNKLVLDSVSYYDSEDFNEHEYKLNLFHELYHLINNAHNFENNTYCKDYYDCFIKSNKENIVTYDNGKQYEEYKAELFNISITNRRFEHGIDYLTSDFMFSIFDSLLYSGKMTNYSFKEVLNDLKTNCTNECFNYFLDGSINDYFYYEENTTDLFRCIAESLINNGISIDEIKSRFNKMCIDLNSKFLLKRGDNGLYFNLYYDEGYYEYPVYVEDMFGNILFDDNGDAVVDHYERAEYDESYWGYNITEGINQVIQELNERNNSINR